VPENYTSSMQNQLGPKVLGSSETFAHSWKKQPGKSFPSCGHSSPSDSRSSCSVAMICGAWMPTAIWHCPDAKIFFLHLEQYLLDHHVEKWLPESLQLQCDSYLTCGLVHHYCFPNVWCMSLVLKKTLY
jgi:hypothetical protein